MPLVLFQVKLNNSRAVRDLKKSHEVFVYEGSTCRLHSNQQLDQIARNSQTGHAHTPSRAELRDVVHQNIVQLLLQGRN